MIDKLKLSAYNSKDFRLFDVELAPKKWKTNDPTKRLRAAFNKKNK